MHPVPSIVHAYELHPQDLVEEAERERLAAQAQLPLLSPGITSEPAAIRPRAVALFQRLLAIRWPRAGSRVRDTA